ncbi:hypothetical protein [Winogradskyella rapida]|uniref:DUF4251 domain-containing protein n=1 Tax=Winogradskyella rapida TaxID=549701 RepID=A0ABW3KRL2_9FLAO
MKKLVLLVAIFSLSASFYGHAQSQTTHQEAFEATYQNMKSIVDSGHFRYLGHTVFESRKRKLIEASENQLDITPSNVTAHLEALDMKVYEVKSGETSNYKVNHDDATQTVEINFNIGADEFQIEVKKNGKAFLTLRSSDNNIQQSGVIERI